MCGIKWPKDFGVDSIGDCVNRKPVEHTLLYLLSEPITDTDNSEIRAIVDPVFQLPLQAGAISFYGWMRIRVRALAATTFPPIAIVAVGTVSSI